MPDRGQLPRVIRFADLAQSPWRNGAGLTREIASAASTEEPGAFAWRLSVSDVADSSEFSRFPGVDRVLVLCRGTDMLLTVDGTDHLLQPHDLLAFPGEAAAGATLLAGATADLNVMTRRDEASAQVTVRDLAPGTRLVPPARGTIAAVLLDGTGGYAGHDGTGTGPLAAFDTLLLAPETTPGAWQGAGVVAWVELSGPA